jgi:hypothetical protein
VGVEWGMVIMGYVQVRLKYPDVFQPAHKTDSTSLLKSYKQATAVLSMSGGSILKQ